MRYSLIKDKLGFFKTIEKFGLVRRFSLFSFGCIFVFTVVFAFAFSSYLRYQLEENDRKYVGDFVVKQINEGLPPTIFTDLKSQNKRKDIGKMIQDALVFGEIFRIKVYDDEGTIIWSDEPRLVGMNFPDNYLLKKALEGKVVSKIEKPKRSEHIYERGKYDEVAEVYVPIYSIDNSKLLGVVEVYKYPLVYLRNLRRAVLSIWVASLIGGAILYVSLIKMIKSAYKKQLQLEDGLRIYSNELEQEKRKLENIVDGIGVGLSLIDRQMNVLWINRITKGWFGKDNDIIGQHCYEVYWNTEKTCDNCPSLIAFTKGESTTSERSIVLKGGKRRFFQIMSSPVKDHTGKVVQVLELIQDITEQNETQAQLTQARKMAAVGELAGGVAHEINNPTGIILTKVTHLLSGPDKGRLDEKMVKDLEMIKGLIQRVARITGGLLDFSRQSGASRTSVDINEVVRKTMLLVEYRLISLGINLHMNLSPEISSVWGNFGEFQQVVLNIINNAIDAMPNGGELTISTSYSTGFQDSSETVDFIALDIEDTGTGISKELLDKIFDPFFTTKEVGKGTGLGLSVSQGIIESHGGKIIVNSTVGKGSRFSVRLPTMKRSLAVLQKQG